MALSWGEIITRATDFVHRWENKSSLVYGEADSQAFVNEFFYIFGIRSQAEILKDKTTMSDADGHTEFFLKGHIMIGMKTSGENMEKIYEQAQTHTNALKPSELPKGILICDFNTFHYYRLEEDAKLYKFNLVDLTSNIDLFSGLADCKDAEYKKQDAVNIEAAEKTGKLHDRLKEIGYKGHQLEVYLVRLLFCLFADDTGIFEKDQFLKYIQQKTNEDGSGLALHIQKIFETLNTSKERRLKTLDEQLNAFPYVNGKLFEEKFASFDFDSKMRKTLIECCRLDWSKISPAIFGAMFQNVMDDDDRHDLGVHYTSEENIFKVIRPLFLDELWDEFAAYKNCTSDIKRTQLTEFHNKISSLQFFDPACGCGNFLVIAYRELRLLEFAVLKELFSNDQLFDVTNVLKVSVDQFYGIEIEEFPSQIARVAMWFTNQQMNLQVRDLFGASFVRIPLQSSANIIHGNSLMLDWKTLPLNTQSTSTAKPFSYIFGNPPFLGSRKMSKEQREDMKFIFKKLKHLGDLDYVAAWYKKACDYMKGSDTACAFVSTNSICQGLQSPILWTSLFAQGIRINFAHQTFKWTNESRGKAAVYCIIVGFSLQDKVKTKKHLFVYDDILSDPKKLLVTNINAYLVDAKDIFIQRMQEPICNVPKMSFGNMPADGGSLIIEENEYDEFVKKEPKAKPHIKSYMGSEEFINNKKRYCLWLVDIDPSLLKQMPYVLKRIEQCRRVRKESARPHLAETAQLFAQITQPEGANYLLIPRVSSERRNYIPIGFLESSVIASDSTLIVPNATLYEFGILTSQMHMTWMRTVCGRLKSDYRYSKDVVYNNFPWPMPTEKQKENIITAAQAVLDARLQFANASFADLYDPDTMPSALRRAHIKLDKAVEKAYNKTFDIDSERISFLFALYQDKTEGSFTGG